MYDCEDGSDEHMNCNYTKFECHTMSQIVPKEHECNGNYDCYDKSDEHMGIKYYSKATWPTEICRTRKSSFNSTGEELNLQLTSLHIRV